jgi:hypothetical protein
MNSTPAASNARRTAKPLAAVFEVSRSVSSARLGEIGHRLGRKVLAEVAIVPQRSAVRPDLALGNQPFVLYRDFFALIGGLIGQVPPLRSIG